MNRSQFSAAIRRFRRHIGGAAAIEYAFLIAMTGLAALGAFVLLGTAVDRNYDRSGEQIEIAANKAGPAAEAGNGTTPPAAESPAQTAAGGGQGDAASPGDDSGAPAGPVRVAIAPAAGGADAETAPVQRLYLVPGDRIVLKERAENLAFRQPADEPGSLLIEREGYPPLILDGFLVLASGGAPPELHLEDGTVLTAGDLAQRHAGIDLRKAATAAEAPETE